MTEDAATEAHLREVDVAIDTAVSGLDGAMLDRLLADEFIYTHAGGKPEAKREFIATAVARVDPPRRVLQDLQVEPHGDVAVTRGTIEFIYTNARPNLYLGYVRVHRLFESGWRAISHRSFYVVERRGGAIVEVRRAHCHIAQKRRLERAQVSAPTRDERPARVR